MRTKTVVLFDVDNTLLDNDRVTADLRDHLEAATDLPITQSSTSQIS